jgi:hypothetical protein
MRTFQDLFQPSSLAFSRYNNREVNTYYFMIYQQLWATHHYQGARSAGNITREHQGQQQTNPQQRGIRPGIRIDTSCIAAQ